LILSAIFLELLCWLTWENSLVQFTWWPDDAIFF
jgi:hypothetical protein